MSVKQYLCGPCLAEKAEIDGVVYCTECEEPLCAQCKQDHAKIKVSKHHKLCDLADVPPQEIQELLKNLIACPNHEKEEVVYLCKDHDMTCCNKCAMADHRKCEEVKVLSDILNDIKVDCTGLKIVLQDFQQQGERLLEHERNHEELVFQIENQALASLQSVKQKLLDIYAQLENVVLSSIADKKKVIGEKIKTNNDKTRQFLNDIKQQSTCFEQVQKFGTNEHVVLLQRQLEKNSVSRLKSIIGDLEKELKTRIPYYDVTRNVPLNQYISYIKSVLVDNISGLYL
ncbi:transcription intermediary factor 1-beta-like [Dreissena polymorpha]|uniref:transcription intermediary factor 1-beta-like n=1 Tax=Dreissena polymorpha TaxID=45954 RepID=UPI002264C2B6|nr:transcription intermediary factor 1-beta-like [Dreissena polymorpha]